MAVQIEQNHTLPYKLGMFIISLLIVICISISLTVYDDIRNADYYGDDGISAKTADSAWVFFLIFVLAAAFYMIYRFIILIADPKFKSGIRLTFQTLAEVKQTVASSVPSFSTSNTSGSFTRISSGGGFDLARSANGIISIVSNKS